MHLLDGDLPYDSYPVVPGHEFYGEVVAVGTDVPASRIGSLVAVDPNMPCRRCTECRRGRSNLCQNYSALGVTVDGGFAELVKVPDSLAYQLPPDMPAVAAQIVEPLSCAIHGFDLLPRSPGDRYLVYGAGTMGLLMSQLAMDYSASEVCVVDPNPRRRELAARMGLQAAAEADEFSFGDGWETVIDCSGAPAAIEDGLTRVRRGGTFQCFGVAEQDTVVKVRPFAVYRDEITILGSMAVLNSFGRAVDIAYAWADRIAPMVSDQFDLGEYSNAYDAFRSGVGTGTKIVINPSMIAGSVLQGSTV
jgi:2-desacetyl-2-hydroxyethyl bacteriochlorophyllide A dehydrogenase